MAQLDADIEQFIRTGATATKTQKAYAARWSVWEAHCADEGVDPWQAPASAFESMWLMRRADGAFLSANTVEGIATAVSSRYAERGVLPAYRRSENHPRWRDLRRSARRRHSTAPSASPVTPLMRRDVIAMLTTKLPWTSEQLARKAEVLLRLEGFKPYDLSRLTGDDVTHDGSAVIVSGTRVECDHAERVRGVPWDCTACAVRDVLDSTPRGGRLLVDGLRTSSESRTAQMRARLPLLAGPGEPWGPKQDLTVWQLAGLRRAAVLWACWGGSRLSGLGLHWVLARAWIALAWSCGLRMASDTEALDRSAMRSDPAGRGWSLTLAATKDDPTGSKTVTRGFSWPDEPSESVAAAVAEYLCVRDALFGPDGPLIVDLRRTGFSDRQSAMDLATGCLCLLSGLAGLDQSFSSYSTRKGYAAQASEDGWDAEEIQEGLRHLHLTTTLTRYMPKSTARDVSRKFIASFETGDAA